VTPACNIPGRHSRCAQGMEGTITVK